MDNERAILRACYRLNLLGRSVTLAHRLSCAATAVLSGTCAYFVFGATVLQSLAVAALIGTVIGFLVAIWLSLYLVGSHLGVWSLDDTQETKGQFS